MRPLPDIEVDVIAWAESRGIIAAANPPAQAGKMMEEYHEAQAAETSKDFAMELGDFLVTLIILAHMHGTTLKKCSLKPAQQGPSFIWSHADIYAKGLKASVDSWMPQTVPTKIGALYYCIKDAAYIQCSRSPEECLEMALAKIQKRSGEMKDGVFVKA